MRLLLTGLLLLGSLFTHASELQRSYAFPGQQDLGYAQVVRVGDTLHLSGIATQGKDMAEQVTNVYRIIQRTLENHGSNMGLVISERVSVTDMDALIAAAEKRKAFYPKNQYPASSWYQISRLYTPSAMIEVEIIAKVQE
ncbi:RidA family protein [Bowmanella sp. Y26]|uniref:RidA family protein n=1 Tax=Bowmanella yangjiangensis TaxID=2811230 RepID=UPI001BDCCFEC|nr:RidA family protein [Bowmanella yangjiangensis]MBT1063330.1 RidA family protein [Bowmanella yangjiangensis]